MPNTIKAFYDYKEQILKIDPSLDSKNFEAKLDDIFRKFQIAIGIEEDNIIRSVNFLAQPTKNSNIKLPPNLTIEKLLNISSSSYIEINDQGFDLTTSALSNYFVDRSSNELVIAPFFVNSSDDLFDSASRDAQKGLNILNNLASDFICQDSQFAIFNQSSLNNTLKKLSDYFQIFMIETESPFKKIKLGNFDIKEIFESIENVDKIGFSTMKLKDEDKLNCTQSIEITDSGFMSFQFTEFANPSKLGLHYSSGKNYFSFPANKYVFDITVKHEIFHSFFSDHFDSLPAFSSLMERRFNSPITIMNKFNELDLYNSNLQFFYKSGEVGALDLTFIKITQHCSIKNGGREKYDLFSKCFEPMAKIEEFFNNITKKQIYCKDNSEPLEIKQYDYLRNRLLIEKISEQILSIELPVLSIRAAVETIGKIAKINDKTLDAVASVMENASRLSAIAILHGSQGIVNYCAVPVAISTLKIADSQSKKFGYKPPSQLTKEALENFVNVIIGAESSEALSSVISQYYDKVPNYIKLMGKQFVFISTFYALSKALEKLNQSDNNKDPYKLKLNYSYEVLAGLLTATASGLIRSVTNNIVEKLVFLREFQRSSQILPRYSSGAINPESLKTQELQLANSLDSEVENVQLQNIKDRRSPSLSPKNSSKKPISQTNARPIVMTI